jgi:hypothetical protein
MSEPSSAPQASGFERWSALSALLAVIALAFASQNLHANWSLRHKDAYFHAAGFVDLGGALVAVAVAVTTLRASRRTDVRPIVVMTVAALTGVVLCAVAGGALLSAHATSLCSCDMT